jgi:hypothetical protein
MIKYEKLIIKFIWSILGIPPDIGYRQVFLRRDFELGLNLFPNGNGRSCITRHTYEKTTLE